MQMRYVACAFLSVMMVLVVLSLPAPAPALVVAAPTPAVKAIQADAIVLGKVGSIDEKVQATPSPTAKTSIVYKVATIEVSEVLRGEAAPKKIRVGIPETTGLKPGGKSGVLGVKLVAGDTGLFYVKKHHAGDFYVFPMAGCFVSEKAKIVFGNELAETRHALKVMAAPLVALNMKDSAARQAAVAVLIPAYQTAPTGAAYKQELIDALESKLILKTLLDADWDFNKYKGANYKQNPALLFNMLSLQPKDGFQNPNKGIFAPEYATAARTWLGKNWQTYALKKVVVVTEQMGAGD
jgi:hypothetical protein